MGWTDALMKVSTNFFFFIKWPEAEIVLFLSSIHLEFVYCKNVDLQDSETAFRPQNNLMETQTKESSIK